MSEAVRQDDIPAGSAGEVSPEQRVPEWDGDHVGDETVGVDPTELPDEDLLREIHSLHRARLDTLRHAADSALANHLRRTAELETEYLARHPGREVDPSRLREL
ncbi:DUF6158 family protein [Micromonospora sp. WMMA1923]|uniref:DUF6158 family protein n=1 Tax=Micromonospora sp. WMMA1923 TaxID=3404125 RepID=UPI003B957D17